MTVVKIGLPVVKVFSATMHKDRDALGEHVTRWLRAQPNLVVTEIRTLLSSDESFHCLAIIVIGAEREP